MPNNNNNINLDLYRAAELDRRIAQLELDINRTTNHIIKLKGYYKPVKGKGLDFYNNSLDEMYREYLELSALRDDIKIVVRYYPLVVKGGVRVIAKEFESEKEAWTWALEHNYCHFRNNNGGRKGNGEG
jgi:hypothetical protein